MIMVINSERVSRIFIHSEKNKKNGKRHIDKGCIIVTTSDKIRTLISFQQHGYDIIL